MCGRYYIDEDMESELEKLVQELDKKIKKEKITGDIRPSMPTPVIYHRDKCRRIDTFRWGFKKYQGSGLVINARAESIFSRRMFTDSVTSRRCIIPASGFYEWDSLKNKFHFTDRQQKKILYMAGIYHREEDTNKFVIITTAANSSMQPVHDRMPVILNEDMLDSWLMDDAAAKAILAAVPPLLYKEAEVEQLRLDI